MQRSGISFAAATWFGFSLLLTVALAMPRMIYCGFAFSATSWFNTFLLLLLQKVIPERCDFFVFQGYFSTWKDDMRIVWNQLNTRFLKWVK